MCLQKGPNHTTLKDYTLDNITWLYIGTGASIATMNYEDRTKLVSPCFEAKYSTTNISYIHELHPMYTYPMYTYPMYTYPMYTYSMYTNPMYTYPMYKYPMYGIGAE